MSILSDNKRKIKESDLYKNGVITIEYDDIKFPLYKNLLYKSNGLTIFNNIIKQLYELMLSNVIEDTVDFWILAGYYDDVNDVILTIAIKRDK